MSAKEELLHRVDQQAAVADLGLKALDGAPLQELMDLAVAKIREALRVGYSKVLQLRPDGETLLLRAGAGWKSGLVGQAVLSGKSDSQAGYTLLSEEPVVVEDASREERFKQAALLREHEIVSGLSVPIQCREKAWGILGAHCPHLRKFSQADVRFLQSVANVLSSAIERLQSEKEATASEQRDRAIVENVIDGIITINSGGIIQSLNSSALRIFGYREGELEGRNVSILMPEEDAGKHDDYIRAYLESGVAKIIGLGREVVGRRKDGSHFPLRLGVGEVELREGRLFVGVVHDLTQEKALQEELMQAQNLASLGEMAASVAHEIKNPLAAISGVIQILKDNDAVAPPYDEIFGELADRISLLDNTVKRLLMFAKPWQPQPQSIDLRELVEHVAESASKQEQFRDVDIQVEAPGAVVASVDIVLFEDVLWNLFYNARDAMPEGGRIVVKVELDESEGVRLQVVDGGLGIPEEALGKLFRPFYTTKAKGTGLGLAICRKIMRLHGGKIEASSEMGKGTCIELSLPQETP
ncbi:MAG TPA: PAS domain S-box protein [Acidobacteriota bacterium]|nr:PAS domain S-box protein [Acidobacteriota bacterium]